MNIWWIVAGIMPLLLFVVVDSFCGLNKGLIVAAIAAVAELILSLVILKTVDPLSLGGLILVLVMGLAAWKMQSPTVFKMQPVVVGLALVLILLGSYAIGQPLLTLLMTKYKSLMPEQLAQQVGHPLFIKWLDLSTLCSGVGIFIQTALVAWAALKLNNWWWIVFRGVGFHLFFFGSVILARSLVF